MHCTLFTIQSNAEGVGVVTEGHSLQTYSNRQTAAIHPFTNFSPAFQMWLLVIHRSRRQGYTFFLFLFLFIFENCQNTHLTLCMERLNISMDVCLQS